MLRCHQCSAASNTARRCRAAVLSLLVLGSLLLALGMLVLGLLLVMLLGVRWLLWVLLLLVVGLGMCGCHCSGS